MTENRKGVTVTLVSGTTETIENGQSWVVHPDTGALAVSSDEGTNVATYSQNHWRSVALTSAVQAPPLYPFFGGPMYPVPAPAPNYGPLADALLEAARRTHRNDDNGPIPMSEWDGGPGVVVVSDDGTNDVYAMATDFDVEDNKLTVLCNGEILAEYEPGGWQRATKSAVPAIDAEAV